MNTLRTLSLLLILVSTTQAQITSFLSVAGRDVVSDQNEVVKLRGINMDGYFWAWEWDQNLHNDYADASDIRFLDSLGANAIRLCLNYNYFATNDGFDYIDRYLTWCDTLGIYVLLDMHVVPQGNGIFTNPAAQQQLIDIWQGIAERYAAREVVLGYDLMNEPWPGDSALWYTYANRLIDSIRVIDPGHIIMVENTLDGELFEVINEPNILYSYHDYSPFAVTHAAADWVGDTPMPADYGYPGDVLSGTEWLTYSEDQPYWTTSRATWQPWDSGNLIVPAGADFAYAKPNVYGNVGDVYYDDMTAFRNGVAHAVYNGGAEQESSSQSGQPAVWSFYTSGSHSGAWSTLAHSGSRSLRISGTQDGWGVWGQGGWVLTTPFLRVSGGDTLRVTGYMRAPGINGGGASLGFDYMSGIFEHYDRQHLRDDIERYVSWSAAHTLPIWCGEFGCMSAAPDSSQENLVRDKIAVMNEAGLGWAMWSYRAPQPPSFTLFYDDSVDVPLTRVIADGFAGATWPNAIQDLTIAHEGADVLLAWSALPGAASYTIYASPVYSLDLNAYTIIGNSVTSGFRHVNGLGPAMQFYLVTAHYE